MQFVVSYLVLALCLIQYSYQSSRINEDHLLQNLTDYQQGQDLTIFTNPMRGPDVRTNYIKFIKPFSKVPQVLITFTHLHFSTKKKNHFTTDIFNVTEQGFYILYQTNSSVYSVQGKSSWFAFTREDFAEVIYYQNYDTGDLNTFHSTGDEHRIILETIKFKRPHAKPPQILMFLLGNSNYGIEWIIASNYTSIRKNQFDMIITAWHHTDVEYVQFAIFVINSTFTENSCTNISGKVYQWDQYTHTFYDHPWNNLSYADKIGGDRLVSFDFPLNQSVGYGDHKNFFIDGINGYDVKNGNFTFGMRGQQIDYSQNIYQIEVGTWQDTQMAGGWWNSLVCMSAEKHTIFEKFYRQKFSGWLTFFTLIGIITIVFSNFQKEKQN